MEGDDNASYLCKLCNDKFKTTAELQKHKRCFHRKDTLKNPCSSNNVKKAASVGNSSTLTTPGYDDHETQYSKVESINSAGDDETFQKGGHYLSCNSCSRNFDAKDPVVLHLLRQSRSELGALKCPFCSEVLLEKSEQSSTSVLTSPTEIRNTKDVEESSVTGDSSHGALRRTQPLLINAQKKRKLSVPDEKSMTRNIRNDNRFMGHNENTSGSHSGTPTLTKSPPVVSPTLSSEGSQLSLISSSNPPIMLQSDQLQHGFEMTYRQPRGKGSRGGRNGGLRSSTSSFTVDAPRNSANAPLKVSVLINNSPYSSAERLAVPKRKHFEKGDIRCPYCGFEAKSVREIQSHVNTHLAKSYPCEFCPYIYRSKQGVLTHTEKHHQKEASKLKASSTAINNSARKVVEDDQRSMFNYSFSFTSDKTESDSNLSEISQDSNMENNYSLSFPATTTHTSHSAQEIQIGSFHCDPAEYFSTTVSSLAQQDEQMYRELLLLEGGGNGVVEKVIDVANY